MLLCWRNQIVTVVVLLLVWAAPTYAATAQNLALGRVYLCTGEILPGWTGLVDGVKNSDQAPACFGTDNSPQFPKEIVLDLGSIYQINKIALYNSLNGNTRHIAVLASINATDFEPLREYYFPAGQVLPLVHSFPARRARYIKITMYDTWTGGLNGDNCLYLREVEVYGSPEGSTEHASDSADMLALARWQQPLFVPYSVRLFRRYCLDKQPQITVGIVGDSFAARTSEEGTSWVNSFLEWLGHRYEGRRIQAVSPRGAAQGLQDPRALVQQLAQPHPVDLLIIAYGTEASLAATPTLQFRRQLQELVQLAKDNLAALPVIVTPAPFAQQAGWDRYAEVKGKDSLRLARAAEQVASLANCGLVRTASVLARSEQPLRALYQDNVTLSPEGHRTISRALEELLR